MSESHKGRADERREDDDTPVRAPYTPPSMVMLGTLQDLTRSGFTGQADAVGFEEIGGS